MQCPIDNTTLAMTDRLGIEIDYCPTCRGIWLDRGELDKIIERSDAQGADVQLKGRGDSDSRQEEKHEHRKKKKSSFIGDIFDGFGGG